MRIHRDGVCVLYVFVFGLDTYRPITTRRYMGVCATTMTGFVFFVCALAFVGCRVTDVVRAARCRRRERRRRRRRRRRRARAAVPPRTTTGSIRACPGCRARRWMRFWRIWIRFSRLCVRCDAMRCDAMRRDAMGVMSFSFSRCVCVCVCVCGAY